MDFITDSGITIQVVELEVTIVHVTSKAILVKNPRSKTWIPKFWLLESTDTFEIGELNCIILSLENAKEKNLI